ncbi:uncharacterized protein LOC117176792 [Belonocnema kinseyi]|uniref:uncharacterized protein LOC117176792 n=1 Tax=Belonocnema kinseyi TaxID=2817044 RepID=UPI00143D73BE|nr:uncharacterized protein LOC117176792 [Belonocnema kinseyi]
MNVMSLIDVPNMNLFTFTRLVIFCVLSQNMVLYPRGYNSSEHLQGLKMPLFKIIQQSRDRKVAIVASSIEEIILKARGEFALAEDADFKVVDDEDGSQFADDEVLMAMADEAKAQKKILTLLILPKETIWVEKLLWIEPDNNQSGSSNIFNNMGNANDIHDVNQIAAKNTLDDVIKIIPIHLKEDCSRGKTPRPADRRLMVQGIAHYMLHDLTDASRGMAENIDKMLFERFPTLGDYIKGVPLGNGFETLREQIYHAVNYRKESSAKKNRKRRLNDPLFDVEETSSSISRKQDDYRCMEYGLPTISTEDSIVLEEKRLELVELYKKPSEWDPEKTSNDLNTLFGPLRLMINAENRNISVLFSYWPFLAESKYLLEHASRVIYGQDGRFGRTLQQIFQVNHGSTMPALIQYCKALCLTRTKKTKNSPDTNIIMDLIKTAQDMAKTTNSEMPNAVLMFQLLIAVFKEEERFLLTVIPIETTDDVTKMLAPTVYPTVMIRGTSIFDPNAQVVVVIENSVLITVLDVVEGIEVAFSAYYVFGYSYVLELPKSLEFIQRFIFDLNPVAQGDKCAKVAKRRLKTFDVKVKNLMSALQKITEPL